MPLATYLTWLRDDALPFWLTTGFNAELGLFYEKLHLDGRPDRQADLRSRVQARQIYVYAHAAELGLSPAETSLATSMRAADRMHELAWAPDGKPGWAHLLTADGRVVDQRRDLYDHAFMLLAISRLAKVSGEARFTLWVDETLDYIDRHLTAPHFGWQESDRHEIPRRQNPHMHLLEASLALYDTTGEWRHLARADAVVMLFDRFFFDTEANVLREFFGPAWEQGAIYGSQRIDPGHHMEWCWLLRQYSRRRDIDTDEICERLFTTARQVGLAPSGFLWDETDDTGKLLRPTSRLWPQTEHLRTLIEQAESLGDPALMTAADDLADRLLATQLTATPRGTWRDQLDADGRLISDHIPASLLYHLYTPAVEIHRLQQQL